MQDDRRAAARCPVCQGPTKTGKDQAQVCRNSLCAFNHREIICPRCGEREAEAQAFKEGKFSYRCGSCLAQW